MLLEACHRFKSGDFVRGVYSNTTYLVLSIETYYSYKSRHPLTDVHCMVLIPGGPFHTPFELHTIPVDNLIAI